jgi:NADH-quinone oxidoreductase subunit C
MTTDDTLEVHIPREEVVRGLRALRNDATLQFDYLRCLTAIDWEERGMEVVYHLYSIPNRHNLTVKVALPPENLTLESATGVWRGANWYSASASSATRTRGRC